MEDRVLIEFMTSTSATLGRIEARQDEAKETIQVVKRNCLSCLTKIPLIETGLNNHLATHDKLHKYLLWPISVGVSTSLILMILRWVIKII